MLITAGWIITGIGIILLAFTIISGKKKNIKGELEELKMITSSGFSDINNKERKSKPKNNIYREKTINENALPMRRRAVSESARELLQEVKSEVEKESIEKTPSKHVISRILVERDNDDTDILSPNEEYQGIKEMPDLPENNYKKEENTFTEVLPDENRTDVLGTELLKQGSEKDSDKTELLQNFDQQEEATDILGTEVLDGFTEDSNQTEVLKTEPTEVENEGGTDILTGSFTDEREEQTEYLGDKSDDEKTAILQTELQNSDESIITSDRKDEDETETVSEKTELLKPEEPEESTDILDIEFSETEVLGTDVLEIDSDKTDILQTDILTEDQANTNGGEDAEETAILL